MGGEHLVESYSTCRHIITHGTVQTHNWGKFNGNTLLRKNTAKKLCKQKELSVQVIKVHYTQETTN